MIIPSNDLHLISQMNMKIDSAQKPTNNFLCEWLGLTQVLPERSLCHTVGNENLARLRRELEPCVPQSGAGGFAI